MTVCGLATGCPVLSFDTRIRRQFGSADWKIAAMMCRCTSQSSKCPAGRTISRLEIRPSMPPRTKLKSCYLHNVSLVEHGRASKGKAVL